MSLIPWKLILQWREFTGKNPSSGTRRRKGLRKRSRLQCNKPCYLGHRTINSRKLDSIVLSSHGGKKRYMEYRVSPNRKIITFTPEAFKQGHAVCSRELHINKMKQSSSGHATVLGRPWGVMTLWSELPSCVELYTKSYDHLKLGTIQMR